jgi:UDP:flavonoid glycosyltransferase YjiC (YdhE family)
MLIVPYGWDQPDNAARIERSGAGIHIARHNYTVDTAATALDSLLQDSRFAERAANIGAQLATERGLELACPAIESLLRFSS